MKLNEEIEKILNENKIYEMANISTKRSGLPVVVYISGLKSSHGPRIKFMNGYGTVKPEKLLTLTVSDDPKLIPEDSKLEISEKELQQIKNWVILNKDVLLELYKGQLDEIDAALKLKKLSL